MYILQQSRAHVISFATRIENLKYSSIQKSYFAVMLLMLHWEELEYFKLFTNLFRMLLYI